MDAVDKVVDALDQIVATGRLVGFAAGIHENGRTRIVTGGASALQGPPLLADAIFPLSSNSKPIGGVLTLLMVELGILRLDDPVAEYLPELSEPRVLTRPDGPLDQFGPAERAITLRHLLTMTAGFGWAGEGTPLAEAIAAQQIAPGPFAPQMSADDYMRRLGSLPLSNQPGRGWNYHNCSDVLGVLLARATGRSLSELLEEHVCDPLGLQDIGFTAAPGRLPISYAADPNGGIRALDTVTRFSAPPTFASLACGLTSTIEDYLRFLDVLVVGSPVLSAATAQQMCTDHLTSEQVALSAGFVEPGDGYGYQVEVRSHEVVGWAGGLGTIGYVNRRTGRSAAVFVPQSVDVPGTTDALEQVWTLLR